MAAAVIRRNRRGTDPAYKHSRYDEGTVHSNGPFVVSVGCSKNSNWSGNTGYVRSSRMNFPPRPFGFSTFALALMLFRCVRGAPLARTYRS